VSEYESKVRWRFLDKLCSCVLQNGERPEDILWVGFRSDEEAAVSWTDFVAWLRGIEEVPPWLERMLHSLSPVFVSEGWWVESDEAAESRESLNWISVKWDWRFIRPPVWPVSAERLGDGYTWSPELKPGFLDLMDKARAAMENVYSTRTYSEMGGTTMSQAVFSAQVEPTGTDLLNGTPEGQAAYDAWEQQQQALELGPLADGPMEIGSFDEAVQAFGTQQPAPGMQQLQILSLEGLQDLLDSLPDRPQLGQSLNGVQLHASSANVEELSTALQQTGCRDWTVITADMDDDRVLLLSESSAHVLTLANGELTLDATGDEEETAEEETQEEWRERVTKQIGEETEDGDSDGCDHTF
jgi:hypothetical protein